LQFDTQRVGLIHDSKENTRELDNGLYMNFISPTGSEQLKKEKNKKKYLHLYGHKVTI